MAQADNSLHEAPEPFQPISLSAICVLARLAARRAVTEQLRAAGVRVTLVKPAEIDAQAQVYLEAHPELWAEARERARRMGMFERKSRRRKSQVMITPDRSVR
jgi:hypothetical protein